MPNYSKNDVILVRYPFADLSNTKVRPAVVVSAAHVSEDIGLTVNHASDNDSTEKHVLCSCLTV